MSETILTEKAEKKELSIVDVRLGETKLSEIWRRAAKELNQIKYWFGDAKRKEACALGAIYYYYSNGKYTHPLDHSCEERYFILPNSIRRHLEDFEKKVGRQIKNLNDEHSWSFERFAEEAEKVGM